MNCLKEQNVVLKLNDSYSLWSNAVITASKKCDDPQRALRVAGYDIRNEASKLVNYYMGS